MGRLVLTRLGQLVFVLLGLSIVSFLVINLLPGNVAILILGDNATPSAVQQLSQQLGLNHPLVVRYWNWLWSALHVNLGQSLVTHQPVTTAIRHALPPSVELVIYAEILAVALSLIFAFWSVWTQSRALDRLLTGVALAGHSMPAFVIGLVLLLIFSVKLGWVPTVSYVPFSHGLGANLSAMALPSVTLALGIFPAQMRVFRGDLYEQMTREEYVSLAWLKGLSKLQILWRHAARNAAAGFITIIGVQIGFLMSGVVLVEQVFSINGVGSLLLTAINTQDAPMVEGVLLFVGVVVVVGNLLADLGAYALDPRLQRAARS